MAGSAWARGVAPAGAASPGRNWMAKRCVSPMPGGEVSTIAGSGGKLPVV